MDQEQTMKDILETVGFLKDNMASKDDLLAFATKDDLLAFATKDDLLAFATKDDLLAFATKDDLLAFATKDDLRHFSTKDDLMEAKSEIMTQVDGFIGLHQKLDLELVALRSKYERLESHIKQLAAHAQIELQ